MAMTKAERARLGDLERRLREARNGIWKLKKHVNALIQSCYYRTKAGKVHWKQGKYYGTSIADDTNPEAFLEAMRAICHNAEIPEDGLGVEGES